MTPSQNGSVELGHNLPLGQCIPPHTPHAISVSLPTWCDNVGYEEGDKKIVDAMVSGYPRFFIHPSIRKLEKICERKYAVAGECCMLFPTQKLADHCRSFMVRRSSQTSPAQDSPLAPRLVYLLICPEDKNATNGASPRDPSSGCALHIVVFPEAATSVAREFWQHSGTGISSRLAEHCLSILREGSITPTSRPSTPTANRFPSKPGNRHYTKTSISSVTSPQKSSFDQLTLSNRAAHDDFNGDLGVYVEERYGRNLPLAAAWSAKRAMRRRISGVLIRDDKSDCQGLPCAGVEGLEVGPSTRGVSSVTEDDVFLYPTGMSAIWSAHQLALAVLPPAKSVCFGFPYTDTLKVLQKWGPGCYFLGHGLDSDIDELEKILAEEAAKNPNTPPVLALFTEFPSNPLLRSADLPRLRTLADKYDFLIVVDETIGNFINVQVLPYADIVVSSLSKIFSGASNVMGGNLILNPKGKHYPELKSHLAKTFEDAYFNEDAIFMERNSRDFAQRIKIVNANAEAVCSYLRSRSFAADAPGAVIKDVFFPKYSTPAHYEHCRIRGSVASPKPSPSSSFSSRGGGDGGFGGLFSLTFTSLAASRAFFDNLSCYKGPSLGTNFTLACPFTILAHYAELEWAAQYGVEAGLVRVSVGLEETASLLKTFEVALKKAEEEGAAAEL